MNTLRHWFWHIVAMLSVCDFTNPDEVSDEEWDAYIKFMRKHAFDGVPGQ